MMLLMILGRLGNAAGGKCLSEDRVGKSIEGFRLVNEYNIFHVRFVLIVHDKLLTYQQSTNTNIR